MNYESMTIEALEKESQILMKDKAKIKIEQVKLAEVLNRKTEEVKMAEKVKSMSSNEKKALVQAISAEAIKSEENVGTPGAK